MDASERMLKVLTGMLGESHLTDFGQLPGLVARHAETAGMADARIFLADLRQQVLKEVTGRGLNAAEGGEVFLVEGTLPGRVFTGSRPQHGGGGEGGRWWVPVLDGTERLGVLRADLPGGVGPERLETLASLVGMLVVSKRPSSDAAARLERTETMNVAAEMQWNLMPPRSFANRDVVIAAALEPAYEIGGDAFDYAIADDQVHLAVFDAMGHNSYAGLAANLAVSACRNQRRQGTGLVATGERVEQILVDHFGHSTYVTAVLADLNATTGLLTWINRGHHPPVLIRGGRWITALPCPPTHPLGTELGITTTLCREQLEPGDRVLLYTDGITEARDARGREFGLHRFTDFIIRHHADGLPVPETLRRLMRAVLDHHASRLSDDATVVCLEWHGPSRNTELRPTHRSANDTDNTDVSGALSR
ncbi:PP2C family protein-serine/threonine phosphatase [Streptomyces sp. Tu 3180]|uniref:PP2C family protein-serine/threonine phosphatase n=1 Tax=Streptomyces sp. Tu 3180 TaxID=2682611 RepID=UPI001FB719CF|nr:PP2C family protein-serine/threonine phosphatase [Streptomyces sp. Tu 3180]